MFTLSDIDNTRSMASDMFRMLRTQARLSQLPALLLGRETRLEAFADQKSANHLMPRRLGIQNIAIDKIVGSFGRQDDFDRLFRPLKENLRERWVSLYLELSSEDWPPIKVYQVRERYFVEDGHHRVSVVRFAGQKFIQAEVWEYPQPISCSPCPPVCGTGVRSVNC